MSRSELISALWAILCGLIGAGLALLVHAPLPFLTGPALVTALAGLFGAPIKGSDLLKSIAFPIVGVAIGASANSEATSALRHWPTAFAALALALVVILWSSRALLSRVFGLPRRAALLAGTPGHLSFVLALSEDYGEPTEQVAVVQSIRLLCLTLLVPLAAVLAGISLDILPQSALAPMGPLVTAALIGGTVLLTPIATRLGLPAAALMTGLILSAATHMTGLIEGPLSPWIAAPALILVGCLIGSRFAGVTFSALRRSALAGLAVTLLAFGTAALAGVAVSPLTGLDPLHLLVAFAPGGLETMAAMGLVLGAPPGLVAACHLGRLMLLSGLVPLFLGREK